MTTETQLLREACRIHTTFLINRYLMACTSSRADGAEKALRHRELCSFYVGVVHGIDPDRAWREHWSVYEAVHKATQALTDYLDEQIEFPLEERPDYDSLVPRFFEKFHALAMKALSAPAQPPESVAIDRYLAQPERIKDLGRGSRLNQLRAPCPSAWPHDLGALLACMAAQPADSKAVAWRYELATYRDGDLRGRQRRWHMTEYKPTVPDAMIRNLRAMTYVDSTPANQEQHADFNGGWCLREVRFNEAGAVVDWRVPPSFSGFLQTSNPTSNLTWDDAGPGLTSKDEDDYLGR